MYGNAEKSTVNWVAWSFGLFLIGIILIVSFYMFVMYLKSQHQKNQFHDEERRLEEERIHREKMAAINNQTISGISTAGSVRENNLKSERSSENTERPESSSIVDEYSVKSKDETKSEKPKSIQWDVPKVTSKEPDELSSKKSFTDLKPVVLEERSTKTVIGEVSVEIPNKPVAPPKVEEKRILSAEKAPGSSIGSDVSTYVISSQRSEMNNYNMLEAGRTPPTFSYTETPLHQTSSIEAFVPNATVATTTIAGTPPTVIPAKQSSETMVSMTTPPIKKQP